MSITQFIVPGVCLFMLAKHTTINPRWLWLVIYVACFYVESLPLLPSALMILFGSLVYLTRLHQARRYTSTAKRAE